MKKLSIVIPAYNEELFIGKLLEIVISIPTEALGYEKEIIVVDDGSKDKTPQIACLYKNVKLISQKNSGKGSAVQNGISNASGDYILVQDGDLEYDPNDYIPMLKALNEYPNAAIYGSRTLTSLMDRAIKLPKRHTGQSFGPWIANIVLTLWTALLYGKWITDTLTAYKIYPAGVIRSFQVKTSGFETDHELTAKLINAGVKIIEIPISYNPRSIEEGKKIRAKDGLVAVWTLLRFKLLD